MKNATMTSHPTLLSRFAVAAAIAATALAGCGEKKQQAPLSGANLPAVSPKSEAAKRPETEGEPRPSVQTETDRTLKAADLIKEFAANKDATTAKYQGKKLVVEGTVTDVDAKGDAFSLEGLPDHVDLKRVSEVRCMFDDDKRKVALQEDQTVKVEGTFAGTLGHLIVLREAAVLETKPVPPDLLQAKEKEAKAVQTLKGLNVSCSQSFGKKWDVGLKKEHVTDKGSIKPEVAGPLQKLRRVRELTAYDLRLSDAALETLKGVPSLEHLNLSGKLVTDAGLVHLKELVQLRELDLSRIAITDQGLAQLKELKRLENLNLENAQITDAGLAALKDMNRMKHLKLRQTKITGPGLAHLQGMTDLESLNLAQTQVSGAGLAHLKGLARLDTLWLAGCPIDDDGLSALKRTPKLKSLDLTETKITDAGLAHLKELPNLTCLFLVRTSVTDAGLANLAALPKLEEIWLNQTKITGDGLKHLGALKSLKHLQLSKKGLSEEAVKQLQKAQPRLKMTLLN